MEKIEYKDYSYIIPLDFVKGCKAVRLVWRAEQNERMPLDVVKGD
jgi:hypothetical protein